MPEGCTSVVIHCASMVTVNPNYSEKLMAVNVGGTRNIITKVLNHPECEKMVYVSSTGAIPEQPHGTPITEVTKFTPAIPRRLWVLTPSPRPPQPRWCWMPFRSWA